MSSFFINPNFFTAPASWVPTDVSGCVLWFDASNAASITSSGGAVSQWADLSGNSNHANQSTAGLKPALGTDATTGYGKITFNGSNDVLVVTHSSSINLVTGLSAFLVCNATGSGGALTAFFTKDPSVVNQAYSFVSNAGGGFLSLNINNVQEAAMAAHPWTGRHMFAGLYDKTNLYGRIDRTAYASAAYTADIRTNTENLYIGAKNASGTTGNAADWFELIIYNNHVGNTNRDTIEAYLRTKWGTP
jgi:hypothetical protein